jgi:hypothetical protein
MKKISFWGSLGCFVIISTIILSLCMGFSKLNILWLIMLLPSYMVGFYLYQSTELKSVYNSQELNFVKMLPKFILPGVFILTLIYFIGFIFGKIVT